MSDIEKAIEQARLNNLARGKVNNKLHYTNACSTDIPEIRAADIQAEDTDKYTEYADEKHPLVLIEFKNAINGISNSTSLDTKSRSLNSPDTLSVDDQLESVDKGTELADEIFPRNSTEFLQAINEVEITKYNATNGDSNSSYDDYDAIYNDSKLDVMNGDSNSKYSGTNGDSNSKYKGTEISPSIANKNTPMCVLPFEKMRSAGFITPDLRKGKLTEEYRRIKRPLLKNMGRNVMDNSSKNVIAVTSSVSGEGKTYSSVNLAMSMVLEKGRTVLLVDADVVKGAAGSLFSIPQDQPGLTDVLTDNSIDVADVIMKTNANNLSFMPCGMMKPYTNELLGSDVMSDLMVELARRYDDSIIILDCPPILQTNEANNLIDHAGQVVFVVAEEDTRQNQVLNAIDQIDNEKYVGVLVNRSSKL